MKKVFNKQVVDPLIELEMYYFIKGDNTQAMVYFNKLLEYVEYNYVWYSE